MQTKQPKPTRSRKAKAPGTALVSATEYARPEPAASKTTVAALFANGPFSRLDDFEESLVRERAPSRDLPEFVTNSAW